MTRLTGKIAIVTGAGGGIGGAIAERFAEEGASVVLTDIDEAAVRSTCARLVGLGHAAVAIRHDVTSADEWQKVIDMARAQFGGLDILVNNAGVAMLASIEDSSFEDWRRILSINLDGVFLGTQAGVAAMKGRGGSIINVASIRALASDPMSVAYDASKAGVMGLTKSAALHCAKQGYGIRINSLHPGYVMTDLVRNAIDALPDGDEVMAGLVGLHPIGRLGDVRDIANAALFLASDEAAFMVGAQLVVDGGFIAQ